LAQAAGSKIQTQQLGIPGTVFGISVEEEGSGEIFDLACFWFDHIYSAREEACGEKTCH
jgi:hypothetical protein